MPLEAEAAHRRHQDLADAEEAASLKLLSLPTASTKIFQLCFEGFSLEINSFDVQNETSPNYWLSKV